MSAENWLDDIAQYLEDQGVGIYDPGEGEKANIMYGHMLDEPTTCLCLYVVPGRPAEVTHDGARYERPGLQAIARSDDYDGAKALLDAAYAALHGLANVTIGAHKYVMIRGDQSIAPVGWANGMIKLSQLYATERKE